MDFVMFKHQFFGFSSCLNIPDVNGIKMLIASNIDYNDKSNWSA